MVSGYATGLFSQLGSIIIARAKNVLCTKKHALRGDRWRRNWSLIRADVAGVTDVRRGGEDSVIPLSKARIEGEEGVNQRKEEEEEEGYHLSLPCFSPLLDIG